MDSEVLGREVIREPDMPTYNDERICLVPPNNKLRSENREEPSSNRGVKRGKLIAK